MKRYDDSLINSEVCMRCAACCHVRISGETGFGVKNERSRKFIEAVLVGHDNVKLNGFKEEKNAVEVEVSCAKLVKDGELMYCGVYENRPEVCSSYNCLEKANKFNLDMPWDKYLSGRMRAAVMKVHGKEIEMPE